MHESKDSTKISWKQQFYQLRVDFTKYFRPQCTETHSVEKRKILSPKNISSNQLFSNLFSKTVTLTNYLPKMRERHVLFVISTHTTVWKNEKFSHWKKISSSQLKVISLVKPMLSRNFCEKSMRGENFGNCNCHAVLKLRIFSQIFRQIKM